MANLIDRIKDHWFISIIIICVIVAGITWGLAVNLLVVPRDFEISKLRDQLSRGGISAPGAKPLDESIYQIVIPETTLTIGTSMTTSDGGCLIYLENIYLDLGQVEIKVTIDGRELPSYYSHPGDRFTIEGTLKTYFIDIHSIGEKYAKFAVFRGPKGIKKSGGGGLQGH